VGEALNALLLLLLLLEIDASLNAFMSERLAMEISAASITPANFTAVGAAEARTGRQKVPSEEKDEQFGIYKANVQKIKMDERNNDEQHLHGRENTPSARYTADIRQ